MHLIDYVILVLVMIGSLIIGFRLSSIASKNTTEFLVAGRKMPWWLIGVADVATGLNTSTMLESSRKVRQDGISGMMYLWGFALKNCVSGVFFERLWRRARFKTQMEFYRERYDGWQANFARIYDTVIFGGVVTSIWAAIGLVGIKKVAVVMLGLPAHVDVLGLELGSDTVVVVGVVLIALVYSASAGARGVYWTDLFQLGFAVVAVYALLIILYQESGGSTGLRMQLENLPGDNARYLTFLQPFSIVYIGMLLVNPLLDQGGFNPGMQRILSLKDEREVLYSLIARQVIGFVVQTIPYVVIGLIGMFLIDDALLLANHAPLYTPEGEPVPDWERAFPVLVDRYLPIGLTGLMAASFLCAFMSSFDSNIHLTGAVVINDLYRPYLVKGRDERHYVAATKAMMTLAALVTIMIGILADDILKLGYLAITISLGGGWIRMLRLVWWRSNGAAEVAAQIFALVVFAIILSPAGKGIVLGLMGLMNLEGNDAFIITRNLSAALCCTLFALVVMKFTKPEPMDKLCRFYRRMRPFGFWGPVRRELGDTVKQPDPIGVQVALVASIVSVVWGCFFGIMAFFIAFWEIAAACVVVVALGALGSRHFILRLYPPGREIEEFQDGENREASPPENPLKVS